MNAIEFWSLSQLAVYCADINAIAITIKLIQGILSPSLYQRGVEIGCR